MTLDDGAGDHRRPGLRTLTLVLLGLLVVDVLLVVANAAHHRGVAEFSGWRWSINADGGWAEVWRSVKFLVAAAYLLRLMERVPRAPVLGAWAATLAVVVLDDLLRFHEDLGAWLVGRLGLEPVAGLRAQDVGELLAWGAFVVVLGTALVLAFRRSSAPARRGALVVGGAVAVVAFFAVGVDMVAIVVGDVLTDRGARWLALLEAGGEMAGAGLVLVAALWLWSRRAEDPARPASHRER
ncbi:MAG: hypothetical protein H5T83_01480, partial [Actinotalea sp.]|nr:hypothetical protein [Actinotalea sp.]